MSAAKSVYSGTITLRNQRDDLVGQIVYDLDFSPFHGEGTFQVHVSGVGVVVSVCDRAGRDRTRCILNYLRRALPPAAAAWPSTPAFSRHSRPACHLDDAYLDASVEKLKFVEPKRPPLYPTHYDGKIHPAIHGHHDAGDYGKYTSTGAAYVFAALNAMAVFPDKFQEDDLGLPYSGNGKPDLVEEVKWELDWLENGRMKMAACSASSCMFSSQSSSHLTSSTRSGCRPGRAGPGGAVGEHGKPGYRPFMGTTMRATMGNTHPPASLRTQTRWPCSPTSSRRTTWAFPIPGMASRTWWKSVKWELDWLENMQDDSDGGVFGAHPA